MAYTANHVGYIAIVFPSTACARLLAPLPSLHNILVSRAAMPTADAMIRPTRRGRNVAARSCGGESRKAADSALVMERATDRTCKVRYGNRRARRHVMHTDRRVAGPFTGTARQSVKWALASQRCARSTLTTL